MVFLAFATTRFFSDPLLIVTLPVASNLRSAGVKWEMVEECLTGVLIETVRDRSKAGTLLVTLVTCLTLEEIGFTLEENVREEDWVFVTTFLAEESPDLFIVTLPVASNLWSAGVKCEITVDALSGVLIDTVRERDKDSWLFTRADEAL